jgi:hypothetical protein
MRPCLLALTAGIARARGIGHMVRISPTISRSLAKQSLVEN